MQIKILAVKKFKDNSRNSDHIEVSFLLDGQEKKECFVGIDEWEELDNGEEKWLKRIKENIKKQGNGIEPANVPNKSLKVTKLKKYGGKTYEI